MSAAGLTLTVDVDAPVEVTWAAVTAWERQGEWMLGTTVREPAPGRLEAITGRPPLGFVDTMEITRWEPPRVCEVRHTGRVVRGTGVFEVVARGENRSRLIWSEQLELPLGAAGALGWRVFRPAFSAGVRMSLRRFAGWAVEAFGTASRNDPGPA